MRGLMSSDIRRPLALLWVLSVVTIGCSPAPLASSDQRAPEAVTRQFVVGTAISTSSLIDALDRVSSDAELDTPDYTVSFDCGDGFISVIFPHPFQPQKYWIKLVRRLGGDGEEHVWSRSELDRELGDLGSRCRKASINLGGQVVVLAFPDGVVSTVERKDR